jgi:hypothetical protein
MCHVHVCSGINGMRRILERKRRAGLARIADGVLLVSAPDGRDAALPIEVRSSLSPRDVPRIAQHLQDQQPGTERGLVVAAYLSPSC